MPPTLRPDLPIGDRIAVWRVHRGMTRQACAVLVGRSLSWWTNIETGVRRVDMPSDLALVAAALGVGDLDDLTGPLEFPLAADRPEHPVVAVLRSAMLRATSPALDLDRSVADPPSRLAGAQRAFHSDRTPAASTGRLLRDLIPDAATRWRRAGTEPARRTDAVLLSRAYLLACRVLRHLSAYDLAATAAERATGLARAAEDPVGLAWAMWQSSGVLKDAGRAEEGLARCRDALDLLGPALDADPTDERISLYAEMAQQAGLMAAYCGDAGTALRYQDEGGRAYGRVSAEYRNPVTGYGRDGRVWAAVWIPNALGRHRAAIAAAERIDVTTIPSRPLWAWWWIRAARGHAARHDDPAALRLLRRAENVSPETVAYSADVRETCRDMLRRDHITTGLHTFAHRIGLFT